MTNCVTKAKSRKRMREVTWTSDESKKALHACSGATYGLLTRRILPDRDEEVVGSIHVQWSMPDVLLALLSLPSS